MLRVELEKYLKSDYKVSRLKVGEDKVAMKTIAKDVSTNLTKFKSSSYKNDYLRKVLKLGVADRKKVMQAFAPKVDMKNEIARVMGLITPKDKSYYFRKNGIPHDVQKKILKEIDAAKRKLRKKNIDRDDDLVTAAAPDYAISALGGKKETTKSNFSNNSSGSNMGGFASSSKTSNGSSVGIPNSSSRITSPLF